MRRRGSTPSHWPSRPHPRLGSQLIPSSLSSCLSPWVSSAGARQPTCPPNHPTHQGNSRLFLSSDGRPLGARLDGSQSELTSHTLELREAQQVGAYSSDWIPHSPKMSPLMPPQSFVFDGVSEKPVLSLLRDFSAPIRLVQPYMLAHT